MAKFKDTQSREWTITLTDASAIMEIRKSDSEFLKGEPAHTFARLENDPFLLCQVIYVLCLKQIQERGLSEEDFYLGIIGDSIEVASDALIEAIVDFFPRGKRELLNALASKTARMNAIGMERAMARLNDPNLETMLVSNLERKLDAHLKEFMTPFVSA